MMKTFKNIEFVIFDVETTGLSPQAGDRMVEIAALKVKDFKSKGTFHSLIDPQREISFGAFEVNGITEEMLEGAPKAKEILPDFLQFLGDAVLVGHNVSFDLGFLCHELSLMNWHLAEKTIVTDTLKMARGLLPHLGRYPLWFVAQSLGVEKKQQHRAMADVNLTYEVFRRLVAIAEQKGINDADILIDLFSINNFSRLEKNEKKINLITDAIAKEEALNLVYFSRSSASTTSRKVTPKKLVYEGNKITLVGFCHLRNEERDFRIDKILDVSKV